MKNETTQTTGWTTEQRVTLDHGMVSLYLEKNAVIALKAMSLKGENVLFFDKVYFRGFSTSREVEAKRAMHANIIAMRHASKILEGENRARCLRTIVNLGAQL